MPASWSQAAEIMPFSWMWAANIMPVNWLWVPTLRQFVDFELTNDENLLLSAYFEDVAMLEPICKFEQWSVYI